MPDVTSLYLATIRNELRNAPGFTWQAWQAAAQYCLQQNVNLEEALTWADTAIRLPGVGQANFATLETKAAVLSRLKRESEAAALMDEAMRLPNALPVEIHQYGRQLQARGRNAEALAVFQKNAARFGDAWPTHVGLARGYSATGDFAKSAGARAEGPGPGAGPAQQEEPRRRRRRAEAGQGHERDALTGA